MSPAHRGDTAGDVVVVGVRVRGVVDHAGHAGVADLVLRRAQTAQARLVGELGHLEVDVGEDVALDLRRDFGQARDAPLDLLNRVKQLEEGEAISGKL